jgi:hypothetical protein
MRLRLRNAGQFFLTSKNIGVYFCILCFQSQPFGGAARPPADLLLPGVEVSESEPGGPEQAFHGSCNGSSMSEPFIVKCCRHQEIFNPQSGRTQDYRITL